MDVSVKITVGTFAARVKVADTGPDGVHDAIEQCRATALEMVGPQAVAEAATAVWVER